MTILDQTRIAPGKTSAAAMPTPASPPRRRSWAGRIAALIVVAIPLGAWFAPQIVSQFAGQPNVLKVVAPELPDNLRIGKATLNWQAPILLHDVSLVKEDGSDLVKVDSVTSEQTLWDLVRNNQLPLTLHFEGLQSTIVIRTPRKTGRLDMDWAAVEISKALQKVLDYKVQKVKRPVNVHIKDGAITLVDSSRNVLTRYQPITGNCQIQSNTSVPGAEPKRSSLELTLPVQLPPGPGKCELKGDWAFTTKESEPGDLRGSVELEQVPVDALHPVLGGLLDGGLLTGTADGHADFKISRLNGSDVDSELTVSIGTENHDASPTLFVLREGNLPAPFLLQSIRSGVGMKLSRQKDQLELTRFDVESRPLSLSLTGQVTELSGPMNAEVSGKIRCDLPDLLLLLPAEIRDQIQVDGLQLSGISVKGALRPPRDEVALDVVERDSASLDADSPPEEASAFPSSGSPVFALAGVLTWQKAMAFGLESGTSTLHVALQKDQVLLTPVDVSLNNGKLVSLPEARINGKSSVLLFKEGPALEKVRLSEELCRGWLRYVSPVMADATRVAGTLNISTGTGALPLENLSSGSLTGTLVIQGGELGAGPLVQPILGIVEQVRAIGQVAGGRPIGDDARLRLVEQNVPFALQDGRVHHANLGFYAGDVILSTSGSVGLDESLDLVLRIQMPEKWFENRGPVLASLKGESIDVAIRGTLDRPQLDPRPLADFGKRIGAKAAGGLIFDLLNRGVERRQQRQRP